MNTCALQANNQQGMDKYYEMKLLKIFILYFQFNTEHIFNVTATWSTRKAQ